MAALDDPCDPLPNGGDQGGRVDWKETAAPRPSGGLLGRWWLAPFIYLILGSVWIIASDLLLPPTASGRLFGPEMLKGLGFVATTALLLAAMLRWQHRLRERIAARMARMLEAQSSAFRTSGLVHLLIDPTDGRLVDANNAAAAFYGWPIEQLRRMRITEINTQGPIALQLAAEEIFAGRQGRYDFQHRTAHGIEDVEVHAAATPVDDKVLISSVVIPVTEQRRIAERLAASLAELELARAASEAQAALLRTSLDAFPGLVAVYDADLRVAMVNSMLALLMRRPADELVGILRDDLPWQPEWQATNSAELRRCIATGSSMLKTVRLNLNGVDRDHRFLAVPFNAGGKTMLLGAAIDITDLVAAREAAEQVSATQAATIAAMRVFRSDAPIEQMALALCDAALAVKPVEDSWVMSVVDHAASPPGFGVSRGPAAADLMRRTQGWASRAWREGPFAHAIHEGKPMRLDRSVLARQPSSALAEVMEGRAMVILPVLCAGRVEALFCLRAREALSQEASARLGRLCEDFSAACVGRLGNGVDHAVAIQ